MKMLNKLKFNNLVISNKQAIQQCRIQTINKLVHKIRKLKTLLEKHPDNKKIKERIRKAAETIESLKKLKRMDIMKKILLMDKPALAIITNGLATPEEVAVALLSMNKVMQSLINEFRMKLQLKEVEKDDWKQVLTEASKRSKKMERTEEKRRKRLEFKLQKAMGRKRQEWLEENQHNIDENISGDTDWNVSTTGTWKIEELCTDNIKKTDETISIKTEKPFIKKTILANNQKEKIEIKDIRNAKNKSFKKEGENDKLNKNKGKSNITKPNQNESSSSTASNADESLMVDPFFITGTGENYMSTAIIKRETFDEEKNIAKRDLHMIKLNNSNLKPVYLKGQSQSRENKQKYLTQKSASKWNSEKEPSKFLQRKFNDKNNTQIKKDSINKKAVGDKKNLHPSWIAKQKLKPFITGFQGKKITFEDNASSQSNKHQEAVTQTKKLLGEKANKSEKDTLHPSWAAKQKLKPTITAFQGKKITFDNDE